MLISEAYKKAHMRCSKCGVEAQHNLSDCQGMCLMSNPVNSPWVREHLHYACAYCGYRFLIGPCADRPVFDLQTPPRRDDDRT